jgi:hypothetical protein
LAWSSATPWKWRSSCSFDLLMGFFTSVFHSHPVNILEYSAKFSIWEYLTKQSTKVFLLLLHLLLRC